MVLTPEHGNLGDHAIALAEHMLLKKGGIKAIEITGKELKLRRELGSLRFMNGRTILINGGGNLGTLWFSEEKLIRDVIRKNPQSKIVIFPSTIYYEDSEFGDREKQNSLQIYNSHKHLTIFLREQRSYRIASELYKDSDVKLMPDMVFYLDYSKIPKKRHGCILCLRTDREKTRSSEQDSVIIEQVEKLFDNDYCFLDMVTEYSIPVEDREIQLEQQFSKFKEAELVITDRLHGMIFSAITGTPCIVIESKSHKVRGCIDWIQDLQYIRFCEDVGEIEAVYSSIPKGDNRYDNTHLLDYYDDLLKDVVSD